MIELKNPKDCCGCTACANICPREAILMKPDNLGFLYPNIDKEKCIDCGLCENVCAFNNHYDISDNFDIPLAYAARHKDVYHLNTSRSGGAFIALSDFILEQGGIVYGAGWTDDFMVVHKRATTKEQRNEFKGSKYIQSDLTGIFKIIKQDLISGKAVLFSGTGCQVAGLKSFIGNKYRDNLYLVDIVCHGVPSPFMWKDYLKYIEKKEAKKIVSVNFRDKSEKGWAAHFESFLFEDGSKKYSSMFRDLFFLHVNLRYSCYNCPFCNLKRVGDVSLADYWGWQRTNSDINADNKGCSLVLCNTPKGKRLFESVKDRMNTIPAELANVMQSRLSRPSEKHPKRMQFEIYYKEKGFKYAISKVGIIGWRHLLKSLLNNSRHSISAIRRFYKNA